MTEKHQSPFPILADEANVYYGKYNIQHSMIEILKGMFLRMPNLLYAMFGKGYMPLPLKGRISTMPAKFLVDENGIICLAHYGKDEGDHLAIDKIVSFSKRKAAQTYSVIGEACLLSLLTKIW